TGDLHIMDVYQSQFTGKLVITVSCAVTDANDHIIGVLGCDIQVEQLLKRASALKQENQTQEDETNNIDTISMNPD
ncbi:MAG: PDC sensor domain-containing protein, partial [Desulfovibrio sp.]|nr:PDC sensor domain-containing protein [Desulfovibrio sp.]